MKKILELKNISVNYNGVKALDNVSLALGEGEIVALMGPNGAGKSSILKAIFGLVPHDTGEIFWQDSVFKPLPHEVVNRGIAFVPQGRRVFNHLTVEENLEIGAFVVKDKEVIKQRIAEVTKTFPVLKEKLKAKAGSLSGGQQQMLALARGLMVKPKVLLLDEPSLGLAPNLVKEVFAKVKEINKTHKTTVLVVEHNLKSLLQIVDRAYVLDKGKIVAENTAHELINSDILEKIFLGK